jgi:hypothetical protein
LFDLLAERPNMEIAGRDYRTGQALRAWLEETTGFEDLITPSATMAYYGLGDLFGVYPHTEGNSDFVYHFDDWLEKFAASLDGLGAFITEVEMLAGGTSPEGEPITEENAAYVTGVILLPSLTPIVDSLLDPASHMLSVAHSGFWGYRQKWYQLFKAGYELHRMKKTERAVLVDNVLSGGLDGTRALQALESGGLEAVKKPFAGLRRA